MSIPSILNFFAILTTSFKLCSTSCFFASLSPFFILVAKSISSSTLNRGIEPISFKYAARELLTIASCASLLLSSIILLHTSSSISSMLLFSLFIILPPLPLLEVISFCFCFCF